MAIQKYRKIPNYQELFNTFKPKQFVDFLFTGGRFYDRMCSSRKEMDFNSLKNKFRAAYNYHHSDDLYKFFQINHSFNSHKDKYQYELSLFVTMTDIIRDTPLEEFEPIDEMEANPIYIYYSDTTPHLANVMRDFCYWNMNQMDTRDRTGELYEDFMLLLKKLYQKELLPLDITQPSYY